VVSFATYIWGDCFTNRRPKFHVSSFCVGSSWHCQSAMCQLDDQSINQSINRFPSESGVTLKNYWLWPASKNFSSPTLFSTCSSHLQLAIYNLSPIMAKNTSWLPTTISDFISFLDGNPVKPYGNDEEFNADEYCFLHRNSKVITNVSSSRSYISSHITVSATHYLLPWRVSCGLSFSTYTSTRKSIKLGSIHWNSDVHGLYQQCRAPLWQTSTSHH